MPDARALIVTSVNSSVLLQIHLGPESLVAELTLEVAITGVNLAVDVQREFPGKVFAAKFALVRALQSKQQLPIHPCTG